MQYDERVENNDKHNNIEVSVDFRINALLMMPINSLGFLPIHISSLDIKITKKVSFLLGIFRLDLSFIVTEPFFITYQQGVSKMRQKS